MNICAWREADVCPGLDQRKLFTAAKEWLPKLGYKEVWQAAHNLRFLLLTWIHQRAHLLNPMVPGLHGGKMSSSEEDSKIDLLDTADAVTKKIRKAVAVPKVVEENGLLAFVEYVLLPASGLLHGKPRFTVERERDGLETLVYGDIAKMHEDYRNDTLTPQLLKPAVSNALNELLEPIRKSFEQSPEWQEITTKAYPPPPKKEKKAKNKGTRHPAGAKPTESGEQAQALPDRTA